MSNTAYESILTILDNDETVEAVLIISHANLLTLDEAKPYLIKWTIDRNGFIAATSPFYVWTNKNIIFVVEYDGATWLEKVPRNPSTDHMPIMAGR